MRVLAIDDDALFLAELKRILIALDVEAHTHASPHGSLYAARVVAPDLILLDLNMPELDGKWLYHDLRKACPQARIYFCSDIESGRLKHLVRAIGADGIISKTEVRMPGAPALRGILGRKRT